MSLDSARKSIVSKKSTLKDVFFFFPKHKWKLLKNVVYPSNTLLEKKTCFQVSFAVLLKHVFWARYRWLPKILDWIRICHQWVLKMHQLHIFCDVCATRYKYVFIQWENQNHLCVVDAKIPNIIFCWYIIFISNVDLN